MASGSFKLNGNTPTVTWADPKSTPDHTAAAQVNSDLWVTVNSCRNLLFIEIYLVSNINGVMKFLRNQSICVECKFLYYLGFMGIS